jgi:hypothetical protein
MFSFVIYVYISKQCLHYSAIIQPVKEVCRNLCRSIRIEVYRGGVAAFTPPKPEIITVNPNEPSRHFCQAVDIVLNLPGFIFGKISHGI